ncbi:DNA N-6-adenine-methyltransferase [Glycomyces tenuis]|uniref:DNA N-6-adenine-methyltransferase n=1 Tax=Glycomyces tenuis TaxID=58116 RepID=UPI0004176F97|nr:DNA N-6-adenine-methyltransferase [Glycomyces tenuis]
MASAIGAHHSARARSNVWLTPPGITEALGPFDLDPCGHEGWPTAKELICPPRDGLTEPWHGRVWLNCPYREIGAWLAKLADHGDGIALTFARTETAWFIDHIWKKATGVKFLHGRIRFWHPEGYQARDNAGAPSVLAAYGPECARSLRDDTRIRGTYLPIRSTP